MVVSEGKLPSSVSSFLGLADGLSRPGRKLVDRADLDMPGTADVDRSSIVWSLGQQKHEVKARKVRRTDIFIHDGDGSYSTCD
eukprot:10681294-Karenia_brevis.AAC.1